MAQIISVDIGLLEPHDVEMDFLADADLTEGHSRWL